MSKQHRSKRKSEALAIRLGNEELVIHQRYQALSILNDFLIAIWFLVGSLFFLFPALQTAAIWCFIVGSAQFLLRPSIRLAHQFHLGPASENQWEM